MGSIAMGIVLIYLHLALFVTYQLAVLYWAKKTILIIIQILNGVLFVSPFVLDRYEVLRAVERNATGLDAMPFAWFALVCMLSIAYFIAMIILLITAEIRKKKERTLKNKLVYDTDSEYMK